MICVHDIIAITGLAVRVSIAYKDASNDYRYISEEVAALKLLVDRVAPHFKSTPMSREEYQYGEKVLKDCQGVLENLNSFIGKYQKLASINKRLVLNRVKLGKDDITALQVQLISNTVLLNGFVRRCVVLFINAIDINIFVPVVNMLRSKHNWLIFLASAAQARESQYPLLLLLQPMPTPRQPTSSFANTCIKRLGSRRI